jgi:pimeloyl-ACP methyl ester carboxylesterase/DNA-binding CsgD family transcriptional regulator
MEQVIRFCTAPDGVRLAYAAHGHGPVIVKAAHWLTHLEHDWRSPVWRHWLEGLGEGHRVVRYDERGCGLSDRDPGQLSLDAFVGDLESVVDAAGLDRFALLGASQGAAVAIGYAVRHPERVSHLVLCGGYARGRLRRAGSVEDREEAALLQSLVRVGWGRADPAFRRVFTMRFVPDATLEQMTWFDELQRMSASPETAERLRAVWAEIDVTDLLDAVRAQTLVAHARHDAVVPFEEGRMSSAAIPDARFLPLESRNHVLLAGEPAWPAFLAGLREFLGTTRDPTSPEVPVAELSPREVMVLRLVAAGLGNDEIARELSLSVRTVECHLSNCYGKLRLSGRTARVAVAAWITQREPPPRRG